MLAGVSIDYYTQLERGKLAGVSDTVLDAIAGALQLDEAERAHLFDLARRETRKSRMSLLLSTSPGYGRPARAGRCR
jgi:transcriptional regulator with XRE-family HTH domain